MNYSMTYGSFIVFLILMFLKQAGIEAEEGTIVSFVGVLMQVVSAVGVFWGRYRAGGVSLAGVKQ